MSTQRASVPVHHALVANSRGVWTLSGRQVAGPLTSTEDLLDLLDQVRSGPRLTPCNAAPQVWLCGAEIAVALGWNLDYGDDAVMAALEDPDLSEDQMLGRAKKMLSEQIGGELVRAGAAERGWTIAGGDGSQFRGGPMVPMKSTGPSGRWFMVNVFVETYMWTLSARQDYGILGSSINDSMPPNGERETTAEIARRLQWITSELGVLPSATAAGTAAALLDAIFNDRKKRGKGAFVAAPTPWPAQVDSSVPVEHELLWWRSPSAEELDGAECLVTVDQRASYLASAGSQEFGWGQTELIDRRGVERVLSEEKTPFALWHVTLPAGAELSIDERMPLPIPGMRESEPVQRWITTESLLTLTAAVGDGGAGIDVWDLDIDAGYLYEHQGRILEAWAKRLREARARAVAEGDAVAKSLVGSMYKGYVGRLVNEASWSSSYKAHHFQPMWRYAIIAGARRRGRRHAARIAAEAGLYPIASHTDSWTYLCASDEQAQALSDTSSALGRLVVEKQVAVTGHVRAGLESARSLGDIEKIFRTASER